MFINYYNNLFQLFYLSIMNYIKNKLLPLTKMFNFQYISNLWIVRLPQQKYNN